LRPDGSMRYLHTWAHPVLDDDGKLVRLVGVCQDITDRCVAEERVRQLNIELEQRVEERTRALENSMKDLHAFNAMLSHDLRAPLAVTQLSCAVLRQRLPGDSPREITETVERIEKSV